MIKMLVKGAASIGEAMGSLLDFSPKNNHEEFKSKLRRHIKTPEEGYRADAEALRSDWKKVIKK